MVKVKQSKIDVCAAGDGQREAFLPGYDFPTAGSSLKSTDECSVIACAANDM